jgi:hypothetical protein
LRHQFPFAFLDPLPESEATACARLSATSQILRFQQEVTPFLLVEMLAQATLYLPRAGASEPTGQPQLAGIEDFTFGEDLMRDPLQSGDVIELFLTVEASLGKLLKVRGRVERRGRQVAEGSLLLAFA